MKNQPTVTQRNKHWDVLDEEAERQATAMRSANMARTFTIGKGKKVGGHLSRV